MQDSVATPRPPSLRHRFGPLCRNAAQIIANGNILYWERVGPTQRPHGDIMIMRCPRADAGYRDEWLNTITLRDDHLPPLAAARYTI
jgi:hypothetical protein